METVRLSYGDAPAIATRECASASGGANEHLRRSFGRRAQATGSTITFHDWRHFNPQATKEPAQIQCHSFDAPS